MQARAAEMRQRLSAATAALQLLSGSSSTSAATDGDVGRGKELAALAAALAARLTESASDAEAGEWTAALLSLLRPTAATAEAARAAAPVLRRAQVRACMSRLL
jgi:hypothetical protein